MRRAASRIISPFAIQSRAELDRDPEEVNHFMTESRELPSVVDEAQRAAAAGDYASAERLLREAAQLQETQFGPLHPDLANTLNNLGVRLRDHG